MGLARGFFGAGAASVVGSLSTVQEEPTLELMKVLYDEMLGARRLRPAAALQAAQIRMIEHPRFGDPFYWSPFVFMGDPR
jgi:CHAT domain-containing protein